MNNEGRVIGKRTGEQLYSQSYDPVLKETRDMLYRKKRRNAETADGLPDEKAGREIVESKKKTPVWLLVLGGILAAYGGYLLNGIWEKRVLISILLWSALIW